MRFRYNHKKYGSLEFDFLEAVLLYFRYAAAMCLSNGGCGCLSPVPGPVNGSIGLGNVQHMVPNPFIIRQHFRIKDGGFHITIPIPHTVNLVLTELQGDIVNALLNLLSH